MGDDKSHEPLGDNIAAHEQKTARRKGQGAVALGCLAECDKSHQWRQQAKQRAGKTLHSEAGCRRALDFLDIGKIQFRQRQFRAIGIARGKGYDVVQRQGLVNLVCRDIVLRIVTAGVAPDVSVMVKIRESIWLRLTASSFSGAKPVACSPSA